MGYLDRFRKQRPPTPDRRPLSAPGRAHTEGFIQVEEKNPDLLGTLGFDIYDRMYRTDGDVRQVVQMVVNPISSGTWEVVAYGGDQADKKSQLVADVTRWALWDCMCPNILGHLSEVLPILIRSGFTPYEKIWTTAEYEGKTYLVPRKLDLRLPKTIWRWFQDVYGDLESIVQMLPVPLDQLVARGYSTSIRQTRRARNGETLMPGEVELLAQHLVYYRMGAEGDNWEGVSLLRPAYKHWLMKDAIERIDAIAQEREAMGIPICYPPMGASPGQLDDIEEVLKAMRTNEQGYIVAPGPKAGTGAPDGQGWLFEILGYDRSGSGRDPQPSLAYHTQKIAAAFISEFMRLGHGETGARATAQVQADPFLLSIEAMVGLIEQTLNEQLIKPFIAYNFPDVEHPPRLQMSLVDSTSLSQLADYVLKLTQVGAMFPDQDLEAFLRDRADLPPMRPDSLKARKGKKDDDLRREVVTGGGDAFGANAAPGKAHGQKPAPRKPSESKSAKQSDSIPWDAVTLSDYYEYDAEGKRIRYRPLREAERVCDLDGIEDFLVDTPTLFARECQDHIVTRARGEKAPLKKSLGNAIADCYAEGHKTVRMELDALGFKTLARDWSAITSQGRAGYATTHIESAMSLAAASARMNHGDDEAAAQAAAEIEGFRRLRAVAMDQGTAAFMHGRHDAITLARAEFNIGLQYSALLDNRTCEACELADDGVVRSIDDPVRLDRQPPNRHCHSTASGFNYCRCIEIPVVLT